ncbi:cobalt-precorrin 5A hydrolase [Micromonospora pisi]|uniref:Cobalt-precorrin 5A hydrolase n=1 Tax=Micromonospora pisi TaxID=589240 RepID=A0A495JTM5_9ACTN|nr:cobalamin biosynthesis protein [Micromonospora pisi]RKR92360.1 cobalt-precorrin 5A hydrolase [Micromonospora pisi]
MSLIVGVGARPGVDSDELDALVGAALAAIGLAPERVAALATVDRRVVEPGLVEVAGRRGWPLVGYPALELAREAVPHPSALVRAATGTPSVAEAAALRAVRDRGAEPVLLLPKRASGAATVAVAGPAGEVDAYRHDGG